MDRCAKQIKTKRRKDEEKKLNDEIGNKRSDIGWCNFKRKKKQQIWSLDKAQSGEIEFCYYFNIMRNSFFWRRD